MKRPGDLGRVGARMTTAVPVSADDRNATLGLWLGFVGVFVFGLTLPMTRLATGTAVKMRLSCSGSVCTHPADIANTISGIR